MAKGGSDDMMFCEACGLHRDQLGLAGDDIRMCPECDRATCTNCWNQVAGACLACRAFALPIAAAASTTTPAAFKPAVTPKAAVVQVAVAVSVAAASSPKPKAPRTSTPRRFKRAAKPQPDPIVKAMPGVVETTALATTTARAARFGQIRIGRVIRATAIGSALAISIAAVGFAGVLRLTPTAGPEAPQVAAPEATSEARSTTAEPAVTGTPVARSTPVAPVDAAVAVGPDERGDLPNATHPPSGDDPTDGPPPATIEPAATATPTAGATATPTADPTATPDPTAEPTPTPAPTEEPTPTPEPPPTPTPEPEPTPTPEPDPTETPAP